MTCGAHARGLIPNGALRRWRASALLSIALIALGACATPRSFVPDRGDEAGALPPVTYAIFSTTAIAGADHGRPVTVHLVPVTTANATLRVHNDELALRPPGHAGDGAAPAAGAVDSEAAPAAGAVTVGVTPWQWGRPHRDTAHDESMSRGRRQIPVGIVSYGDDLRAPVAARYWALTLAPDGTWEAVPQTALTAGAHRAYRMSVGAFFPLVTDGAAVADRFPGGSIRAARVAVGYSAALEELVVITASGSGVGRRPGRRGLTTAEFAAVLTNELSRYRITWALNVDGGRSAYVAFAAPPEARLAAQTDARADAPPRMPLGPRTIPAGPVLRRPGPVQLVFRLARAVHHRGPLDER